MLGALCLDRSELSILLTDDAGIRLLNRAYRGQDRATDVLAFAMREGDTNPPCQRSPAELLGDVAISVPTAARQAKRARRPLEAELRTLLAHGLLHLIGLDHRTSRERRTMLARGRALCRAACKRETNAR
jgi:probable rRNA maturation factor